jgi:hypothetical protein
MEGEKKFQPIKILLSKGIRYRWTVLINTVKKNFQIAVNGTGIY